MVKIPARVGLQIAAPECKLSKGSPVQMRLPVSWYYMPAIRAKFLLLDSERVKVDCKQIFTLSLNRTHSILLW